MEPTTRLPGKGPNSPWSVGTRTLLARTCPRCGRLADGESFPVIAGVGARRSICHDCFNRQKKRDRIERGIGVPGPRPPESRQTARWQRWTREEDTYLREHAATVPYLEIALTLGRSLNSVYTRRRVLGLAAVRQRRHVKQPWRID